MRKQKKRKPKRENKRKSLPSAVQTTRNKQADLISPLDALAEKRSGGAESIKGFIFQCQYAAWKLLTHLEPSKASEEKYVRLEGVEDIDVFNITMDGGLNEFIQVKSSRNRMDAGQFWGEHRILQNFAEVYIKDSECRFRLVHDMPFAEGYLSRLDQSFRNRKPLCKKDMKYWQGKFADFQKQQEIKKAVWAWASFDMPGFLSRIDFEKTTDTDLTEKIDRSIAKHFHIAEGNEGQYRRALCWHVFLWSKDRAVVRQKDLAGIIEAVREDIAKGPINPAVQNRWLSRVSFNLPEKTSGYFEGKPARPNDIAAGLPARRSKWEREILDAFGKSDVTLIRASSGQGKSTLLWQVAFHLSGEGWDPYELHWCADVDKIGNILTFVESRIKIGETPLILIDGLNPRVSEWGELAGRTTALPVKYIVTAREEDWHRFGADRSRLRLRPVRIKIDREEAEDIYLQFQKAGKLVESDGLEWQTAWEWVRDRGLLIEYVYLLTHGTMMEERLAYQIREIAKETNCREKLEILRLISVADLCGVKLPSPALVDAVDEQVGFCSDRGETLKSLQREYQILIEDRLYAEGLHPVRSRHLANILHETISIVETLTRLLTILEADSLHEFCTHAPLLIDGKQQHLFLEKLAACVAGRTYGDMVRVIDGLFSTDAKQYWKINRRIYNHISEKSAVNEVVILNTFPWGAVDTFRNLKLSEKLQQAVEAILSMIDSMAPFEPDKSTTRAFLAALAGHLSLRKSIGDLSAFGRLAQWYSRFDLRLPLLDRVDDPFLWRTIDTLDIADTGDLFDAFHSTRPEKCESFLEKNKEKIAGQLKQRTNTLTLRENKETLHIEYLTYDEGKKPDLNAESVKRAEMIRPFFPCTIQCHVNGIYPPLPELDLLRRTLDESKKRMSRKGIGSRFEKHLKRIWIDNIKAHYEMPSVYEWQKQWHGIRTDSLNLARVCIRFIEAILEGKNKRGSRFANELDGIRPVLMVRLNTARDFPKRGKGMVDAPDLGNPLGAFSKWSFPWRNFLEQFLGLLTGDAQKKNLVNVNIQDTLRKLGAMQDAFRKIMATTFPYFPSEILEKEEITAYGRLAKTVAFCVSNPDRIGKTSNTKHTVSNWWIRQERNRITGVAKILAEFEDASDFTFIPPTRTIDSKGVLETAIGIKGLSFDQLQRKECLTLILSLHGLALLDITFYYFVAVQGGCADQNKAIRVSDSFFKKIKDITVYGERVDDFGINIPYPVSIRETLLETLPGVSMGMDAVENVVTASLRDILVQLWRLTEIRKRLSTTESIQKAWRRELEQGCERILKEKIKVIEKAAPEETIRKYRAVIEDVAANNAVFTPEDFKLFLMGDVIGGLEAEIPDVN